MLAEPRVALMLALGYSAGLPILLVGSTLVIWLRESGVSLEAIGLFSYLLLAYSLKFLWSPIIDAFDVPWLSRRLGRRRAWMITSQLLIAAGLLGIGLSDPGAHIWATAALAFVVAFGSATQDVAVDGWRIDAAPSSRQGVMAAAYQLGYRLAIICSGAGALIIAQRAPGWSLTAGLTPWLVAYSAMAMLTVVGMVATLLSPIVDRAPGDRPGEPPAAPSKRKSFAEAVVAPLADLYGRKGAALFAILALVALYRLPDVVVGNMAGALYVDQGFTKEEIAYVSKLYGVWIGMLGAFAGGLAIPVIGLRTTLLVGGIAGAASNLMFSWLAVVNASHVAVTLLGHTFDLSWLAMPDHKLAVLTAAISVDNFSGSFAGTALIAYMSGLTGPGFAATQYALLSSLYALPGKLIGGLSGFMVAKFGYATFFAVTSSIGIPVVLLCLVVGRIDRPEDEEPAADPSAPRGAPAAAPA
jgi:PAT family beta-lactamase induction signal transducer AmpG